MTSAQQLAHQRSFRRTHGRYDGAAKEFEKRVEAAQSRRFQVELLGDELVIRHREHGITVDEIDRVYGTAVHVGHRGTQVVCLGLLAEVNLYRDAAFSEYLDQLEELGRFRGRIYRAVPHVLAMRSLALGDVDSVRLAHARANEESYRSASWIPTEVLLEYLGFPLQRVTTQWLEPHVEVRGRWLSIFNSVVARVRSQSQPDTNR